MSIPTSITSSIDYIRQRVPTSAVIAAAERIIDSRGCSRCGMRQKVALYRAYKKQGGSVLVVDIYRQTPTEVDVAAVLKELARTGHLKEQRVPASVS